MPLAYYVPSYFEININSEADFDSLKELSDQDQGLYYHEYLHFLQDLTTTYRATKTWNSYDRIRQLIISIHTQTGEIVIPFKSDEENLQRTHLRYYQRLAGSVGVINGLIDDNFQIIAADLVKDPDIDAVLKDSGPQTVDLTLRQENYKDQSYIFGEIAISESMVYLAESKFYQIPAPPKYPYMVAGELARFIYPHIAENQELLFSLCDVSLMHPTPGWAFFKILNSLKTEGHMFVRGEEIIDYGLALFKKWKCDVFSLLDNSVSGILHVSKDVYYHDHFGATLTWFHTLVARGETLRVQHPYFFLNIFRDEEGLGKSLALPWTQLGGPHLINKAKKRFIRMPGGLEHIETQVFPQHLRISGQMTRFLLGGMVPCDLFEVCSESTPKEAVDERCEGSPWRRVNDEFGCPYATFWRLHNFNEKDFIVEDVHIQPENRL